MHYSYLEKESVSEPVLIIDAKINETRQELKSIIFL